MLAFALLGLFPLLPKRIVATVKRRQAYAGWQKPATFDYNLVVIGVGSGGLVAAYIAAAVKAKVALVERERMGGDCLNRGCVPSKALIRSAKLLAQARRAKEFGLPAGPGECAFAEDLMLLGNEIHFVGYLFERHSRLRFMMLFETCK